MFFCKTHSKIYKSAEHESIKKGQQSKIKQGAQNITQRRRRITRKRKLREEGGERYWEKNYFHLSIISLTRNDVILECRTRSQEVFLLSHMYNTVYSKNIHVFDAVRSPGPERYSGRRMSYTATESVMGRTSKARKMDVLTRRRGWR